MWQGIQNIRDYTQCHPAQSPTGIPLSWTAFNISHFEEDNKQVWDTLLTLSEHNQTLILKWKKSCRKHSETSAQENTGPRICIQVASACGSKAEMIAKKIRWPRFK